MAEGDGPVFLHSLSSTLSQVFAFFLVTLLLTFLSFFVLMTCFSPTVFEAWISSIHAGAQQRSSLIPAERVS